MTVLTEFPIAGAIVVLREAARTDVARLVELISADRLGSVRDGMASDEDWQLYLRAFDTIDADPAHMLLVAADDADIVATMQLSFLPSLSRKGSLRAQVEAVRVDQKHRGQGLGAAMFEWAISEAQRRGCALMQLTTDKTRVDAQRFYEGLGFVASHEGLKLKF